MGLACLIAVVFTRILLNNGIAPLPDSLDQVQECSLQSLQKMRATTGIQARASKMPPLVRTYKTRIKLQGPVAALPNFSVLQRTRNDILLTSVPPQTLPKGSRLLAIEITSSCTTGGGGQSEVLNRDNADFNKSDQGTADNCNDGDNFSHEWISPLKIYDVVDCEKGAKVPKSENESKQQIWGTPWTPEEFVERAVAAGHPISFQCYLPETLRSCMSKSLGMTSADRIAARSQALKFWLRRSLELRSAEADLHAGLNPGVEEVVRTKRILLWKEMLESLESIKYPDIGVVEEFCDGATLTGPTFETGLWPKQFTPATLTEGELRQQAVAQRYGLTYDQVVFFNEEIAQSVWQQTLDEVTKGELEGPLPLAEIPSDIPLSKRFGVEQGGKIRCVDDFSASGINAAAQPLESPKPHTLDVVAGMLSTLRHLDLSGGGTSGAST